MSSRGDDSSTGSTIAEAREAALRLLARREHSAVELKTKLARKGWPEEHIDQVIPALAEAGLQSDCRFAESFARQRAGRCYGPRRIHAELAQRGVDSGLAAQAIESLEIDFAELAANFYKKKYGNQRDELNFGERAKRSQVMYRRGFDSEHLRGLI